MPRQRSTDGIVDLAIGAPGRDYARVFSGVDGALLWNVSFSALEIENYAPPGLLEAGFGRAVCAVGDQNGDGHDDLAVGYPAHSSVHVVSGDDGSILQSLTSAHQISSISAEVLGVFFGYSLARVDDRNSDGRSELAVGSPFDFRRESGGLAQDYDVGSVAIVTADTRPGWVWGVRALSGAGDVDGDGHDDIAHGYVSGIEIVSGRSGALLRAIPGVTAGVIRRAGDVNKDGIEDLEVGNRNELGNTGRVRVFSGADGALLHSVAGDAPGDRFGTSVAGVGDLDDDG